jgi:prephenate dehydrogenase
MPSEAAAGKWDVVAIIGVGLIGGSVAAAVRQRGVAQHLIGIGPNPQELQWCQQRGWLNEWTCSIAEGVRRAELVVVCVPVDQIASCVVAAAPHMPLGGLITDVGSTKRNIVEELAARQPLPVEYIPAHPLAGSDKSGPFYADAQLFDQRQVILTPTASNTPQARGHIRAFWESLGAQVHEMSPEEHDRIVAAVSHLPHVLAAALVHSVPRAWLPFAASGFRDTTRVAGGDPRLWSAILLANRDWLLIAMDEWMQQLAHVRRYLQDADDQGLHQWLSHAQQVRHALGSGNSTDRA